MTRPADKSARMNAVALSLLLFSVALGFSGCGAKVTVARAEASPEPEPVASAPFQCEPTPARLQRGRYIVESTAHCFMCHSQIDWTRPGAQPAPGRKGAGHNWADYGVPFVTAPNLTPDAETGAGTWTDQQFASAIREGVGHDGRRLFPIMPYMKFRQMSDEDLASVITYLRSLRPVRNELPKSAVPEVLKQALPPVEHVASPVEQPDMTDPVRRGQYLVTIGNCTECHSPANEQGVPLPGLEFSGGVVMKGPWGQPASANLTPDPSGISYYDEDLFIQTMRTGQVRARKLNSFMPWGYFRKMTDEDLKAIYSYLRTLKPVKHVVDNTEPSTHCRLCGGVHGYGERN
jgi:mono/diheme cytochrome c family protein